MSRDAAEEQKWNYVLLGFHGAKLGERNGIEFVAKLVFPKYGVSVRETCVSYCSEYLWREFGIGRGFVELVSADFVVTPEVTGDTSRVRVQFVSLEEMDSVSLGELQAFSYEVFFTLKGGTHSTSVSKQYKHVFMITVDKWSPGSSRIRVRHGQVKSIVKTPIQCGIDEIAVKAVGLKAILKEEGSSLLLVLQRAVLLSMAPPRRMKSCFNILETFTSDFHAQNPYIADLRSGFARFMQLCVRVLQLSSNLINESKHSIPSKNARFVCQSICICSGYIP